MSVQSSYKFYAPLCPRQQYASGLHQRQVDFLRDTDSARLQYVPQGCAAKCLQTKKEATGL